MTRLDLLSTLSNIAEELDRLRLGVAERLTTAEEGRFLGLVFALEETIDTLPTLSDEEEAPHA